MHTPTCIHINTYNELLKEMEVKLQSEWLKYTGSTIHEYSEMREGLNWGLKMGMFEPTAFDRHDYADYEHFWTTLLSFSICLSI